MKFILSVSAIALASTMGAGAAVAADLMVDNAAIEAATPATTWAGAYVGGHIGYTAGTVNWEFSGLPGSGDSYDISGGTAGIQMGYNWQSDHLVFGAEGVIALGSVTGDSTPFSNSQLNWTASLLGRIGYDFDGFLLYGLAGVTAANATGHVIIIGDNTQTQIGGTVGVGVEAHITDNVSAKLEYNYSAFGTGTYDYIPGTFEVDADFDTQAVQAGVNFHF